MEGIAGGGGWNEQFLFFSWPRFPLTETEKGNGKYVYREFEWKETIDCGEHKENGAHGNAATNKVIITCA